MSDEISGSRMDPHGPLCEEPADSHLPQTPAATAPEPHRTEPPKDTVESAPQCGPCPTAADPALPRGTVEVCQRPVDLAPGVNQLFNAMKLQHMWIRTSQKEAGMGPERGGSGEDHSDLPYCKVSLTDQSGSGAKPEAACTPLSNENEACVDKELAIGKPLGRWSPTNNCHTLVAQVLGECMTDVEPEPKKTGTEGTEK